MKISDIRVHVLEAELRNPFAFSQAWVRKRVGLLVEIRTVDGTVGWGEGYGPSKPLASVIENHYAPQLLGRSALAGDALWETLYNSLRDHGQKGIAVQALSAVDIALWDLRGKYYGAPVYELMGGPVRETVRAYATGLYRLSDDRPANERLLADEAAGHAEAGFTAMKVKVGFGIADDISLIRRIRDVIGEKVELFMDANHGYDLVGATRLARAAEPYDIGWFEEPVEPEDLAGYAELRTRTSIPIAGGECDFTRYGFREILTRRAIDIVQPDTCAAGGLTECKRIADMAAAFGIRYNPHVWGTGVSVATAVHLLAVLPRVSPGLAAAEPLLETDRSEHPFRHAVVKDPLDVVDGWIGLPTGPGLGIEIDEKAVAKFRVN